MSCPDMRRFCAIITLCGCVLLSACDGGNSAQSDIDVPLINVQTTAETERTSTEPAAPIESAEEPAPAPTEEPSALTEEPSALTEEPSAPTEEPAAHTEETPAQTEPPSDNTAPADSMSGDFSKEFFAEDLFIGDSISTGLYLYYKLDPENVAASVGNTPYKAYTNPIEMYDGTELTPLEYAEKRQPKRIFVMLGSNGMASSWDIESMKGSYRTLLEKLSAACPESELCCISVPPVTSDTSYNTIHNSDVVDFNAHIQSLCSEMGLRYFDIFTLLCDSAGNFSHSYAAADGMHFQSATYDVMLKFIQNELS